MIRADLGGSVKRGGGSSSGLLWMSSTCRQAMSPSAVSTRAATVWCSRASVAVWAATVLSRRADQRAHAPHAVQPRHDRLVEAVLHLDAQGVHRHVGHPRRRPVDEQRRAQGDQARRQRGQDQRQRPERQQPAQGVPRAEPVADPVERHRDRGADRREGQRQAELARADSRVVLDPRHPGGEAAGHRPVHGEDGGDGVAGPPHLLCAVDRDGRVVRHAVVSLPWESLGCRRPGGPALPRADAWRKLSGTLPDK